jgi:hypothetical protein
MGYRFTGTKAISINLRSLMRRRHREVTPFSLKSKEEIQTFESKFGGIEDGIE